AVNPDAVLFDEPGRRELSRMLRMRYLVLGEASAVCGTAVRARLIDLRRGVVVQTASVVASSPEAIQQSLPQFAEMLQMSDDDRVHYGVQVAKLGTLPATAAEVLVLSAEPDPSAGSTAPIIALSMRGPDPGAIGFQDITALGTADSVKSSPQD